jgi:hypothetical protein
MLVYHPTGSRGIPRWPSRRPSRQLPSTHFANSKIRALHNRASLAKWPRTFFLDRFLPTSRKTIFSPSTVRCKRDMSCRWQQCTRHSWLHACCCTETSMTYCSTLDRTSSSSFPNPTWLVCSSVDFVFGSARRPQQQSRTRLLL